jgi:hypothetical protein
LIDRPRPGVVAQHQLSNRIYEGVRARPAVLLAATTDGAFP